LLRTALAVVAVAGASVLVPTVASAATTSITFGSGVGLTVGQQDPSVQIVSANTTGIEPGCTTPTTGPAVVLVKHNAYAAPFSGTSYVGYPASCPDAASPSYGGTGATVFRTTFEVPAGVRASLQLSVQADNGIDIALNGTSFTGTAYAYPTVCGGSFGGTPLSFTVGSGFVTGLNTLDFTVDNCGIAGPNALDFQATVTFSTAPPAPTNKDQCKNGGWQSFGGFKNQGDCVSFVASGGKNQPSGA
jgi:hypothetical protein